MADQGAEAHPKTKIILDYIADHSFTEKLNTIVNKLCTVRPADPWDFLVRAFVVQSSKAVQCLDSKLIMF
jgi:hypothetical protein